MPVTNYNNGQNYNSTNSKPVCGNEEMMYKIMTPGPTQVLENVRRARSLACTNPD